MIPKFRAWIKPQKYMVGKGDLLVIDYDLAQIMTQQVFFERGLAVERDIKYYDFEDVVLMQSTDLRDKNGKEIFEGDIISTYTDNLIVQKDNLLGFYVEVGEKRNYFAETVDIEYLDLFAKNFGVSVEILGNIYENPELLEVTE